MHIKPSVFIIQFSKERPAKPGNMRLLHAMIVETARTKLPSGPHASFKLTNVHIIKYVLR